jgi:hypothetical protein
MDATTRTIVRERAEWRCEYCGIPETATPFVPFHVEHVIAQQHLIDDSLQNLALACDRCNAFKGPDLSSVDPATNAVVHLFHPRIDDWKEHFALVEGSIVGLTPKGRATVRLLCMNAPRRVQLREEWAKGQRGW